ncbi:MAG: FHA domain-containing protein, partial [Tissierellia bacterium]|nr:FHA domain-containing protein [Tissierellia bacterium]
NIIRLIYLDIKSIQTSSTDLEKGYLKVINRLDTLSFKMQEYYPLTDELTVGRNSKNDIVIKDKVVSKYHMRIFYEDGLYFIEDLKSSNGTYLNGEEIRECVELRDNDQIGVGFVQFLFVNR